MTQCDEEAISIPLACFAPRGNFEDALAAMRERQDNPGVSILIGLVNMAMAAGQHQFSLPNLKEEKP